MDTCSSTPRRVILTVSIIIGLISITIGVPSTSVPSLDLNPTPTIISPLKPVITIASQFTNSQTTDSLTTTSSLSTSFTSNLLPSFTSSLAVGLGTSFTSSVTPNVKSRLISSLSPSFVPSITSNMPSSLTLNLAVGLTKSLTSGLTPTFTPNLSPSLKSGVTSSVKPNLSPSLTSSLSPSLTLNLAAGLTTSLTSGLTPTLAPNLATSLKSAFTSSVKPNLSPSLTSSLSADLTSSLSADLTGSLSADLTSSLSADLTSSLTSSLAADLTSSLSADLTSSLAPTIASTGGQITTSIQTTPQPDIIEPVIDVKICPVILKIKTNAMFTDELKNKSSDIYRNYSAAFHTALTKLYAGVTGVDKIVIKSFSQGSLICHYEVLFNLGHTFKEGLTADSIVEKIQNNLNKTDISNDLPGDFNKTYFSDQMHNFNNPDIAKRFSDPCSDACPSNFNCVKSYTAKSIKCCRIGYTGSECVVPLTDSISLHDKITIIVSSVVGAIGLILIVMIGICVYNRNKHKGSSKELHDRNSNYRSGKGHENSFMNDRNRADPTVFGKAWSSPGNNEEMSEQNARMARGADWRYEKPHSDRYEMVYSPSRREDRRRESRADYINPTARIYDEADLCYQEIRDPYSHSGEFSIYQPTSPRRGDAMNADSRMQPEMYPDYPYKEKRSSQEFAIRRPTLQF